MSFFEDLSYELDEAYGEADIKKFRKEEVREKKGVYYNLFTYTTPVRLLTASYFYRRDVAIIDPFLSFSDFQNDVKALFIKPLACFFLCRYQFQKCIYELILAAIHLLTFSPSLAWNHTTNGFESGAKTIIYALCIIGEVLLQTLSLIIRTFISIGSGLSDLFDNNEKTSTTILPLNNDDLRRARVERLSNKEEAPPLEEARFSLQRP